MRTNVVIDEKLMSQAMRLSGLKTKRAVLEERLKLMVRLENQRKVRSYFGKLQWQGDLSAMRRDKKP